MRAIKRSRSIISLNFASNELTHKGAEIVFESLENNQSVVEVNLSSIEGVHRNRVGAKGAVALARLLERSPFLSVLNLSACCLCDKGVAAMTAGLRLNRSLLSLNLSSNEITLDGLLALKEGMTKTLLEEIDLSSNPFGNPGVEFLTSFLAATHIRKLVLTNCKFNSMGAQYIYSLMKRNGTLRELFLDRNDLKSGRYASLTSAIWSNGKIHTMSMNGCNLGDDGCIAVADGLSRSRSLERVFLRENDISVSYDLVVNACIGAQLRNSPKSLLAV